ncbi:MAG: hypothetical protein KJ792_04175, partial [Actinobacteria bacterium]|nr:hypothetical protein [Actinomycetota bacterium]
MPIKISIIDDVGAFLKGAGRVETALDDVAGSLDDVAREAQRTGTKAADALGDAGKDMARTTETATER